MMEVILKAKRSSYAKCHKRMIDDVCRPNLFVVLLWLVRIEVSRKVT
jgi:hypothetical protein